MKQSISFRSVTPEDEKFLYKLYASTRVDELAQTSWTEAEKELFLKQQFTAQHQFYMQEYCQAKFDLVYVDKEPVGRLYVDRREDEIRLIDIALLPEFRNKGIGSSLLMELLDEAKNVNKPLRIHVEKYNPALQLYRRLGFNEINDTGVYYLMEWAPDQKEK
jgi:ribosomal protein S18 acetylase RimI-like enzyme